MAINKGYEMQMASTQVRVKSAANVTEIILAEAKLILQNTPEMAKTDYNILKLAEIISINHHTLFQNSKVF